MSVQSRHGHAPPVCGRRLLSHVIDQRASTKHQRPFASIARTERPEDGYRDISYAQFANAVNRLTHWIWYEIGYPSPDCETLVYLAAADLRYQVLTMAAVKAGYVCGATKLLTSNPIPPGVSVMMESHRLWQYTIPSLEELLDPTPVPHIALHVTWEEWRFRPFIQIHSSGSTGIPKLITLKHGSFTALDAFQLLQENELHQRFGNMRICVTFPSFHIAGVTYGLASPIWVDSTVVFPPAVPLTADVVSKVLATGSVEFALLPPSLLIDMTKTPEHFSTISRLSGVTFAGGPLPEATGRQIAEHTRLLPGYGASEWNAVPQLTKAREDWAYFHFNEEEGGLEFRERDKEHGLYEMVICHRSKYALAQPVFVTFPEIQEFESKDLFSKHPSGKKGMWKYVSRLDDIIVFSNGEKLNPVTLESLVTTSPDVSGALVVGQGRFQAVLLIEAKDAAEDESILTDKIWPYVQRANEPTVKHGRIARDCIFYTKPGKPLPRAGKGTIQRAPATALYSSEIDSLYVTLQATSARPAAVNAADSPTIDFANVEATKSSLAKFITTDLGLGQLNDNDDFFILGMDSLQVLNIVRAINASRSKGPIEAKHVYDHPTLQQLARSLHGEAAERYLDGYDSDDEELKESWLAMDEMFRDLTSSLNPNPAPMRKRQRYLNGWLRHTKDTGPVVQPDGGRTAWLQVLAMFLVNINNWGLVNSFGAFQIFYESTLLHDYSPFAISWIGTIQGALLLLVGVLSGPLFDQGYFKPILTLASIGLVFALMMLSISSEYYEVILTQGILCGFCSGLLYVPSVALVPVYFKHHRGLALGLATSGGSIGGVIYPIVFQRLLVQVGFGWAVRTLAFLALLTLGTAVVISRPIGARTKRQLIDTTALSEWPYVLFLVSAFFLLSAMFVPFFLASTYSSAYLRASPSNSFYTVAVVNSAQLLGRLLPAWYSDYDHKLLGPEVFQFVGEFLMGILGFAWVSINTIGGFWPWLIFYGFFSGMAVTLPAVVLPYICSSLATYGTRLGMLYGCAGIGFLISTPIASAANARSGSFLGSQVWTGACCVIASLLFIGVGSEVRTRRLLAQKGKKGRRIKKRGKQVQFNLFGWTVEARKNIHT